LKSELAERLLAEVMRWDPEDVKKERPELQALASYKYDEYQQFSPGMRFVESFGIWLNQFESDDERTKAYKFIRSDLLYISELEMKHFVSIAYPDYIRPYLINQVGKSLSIPETATKKIISTKEFRVLLRQSLFLGLSDGAHIDLFRRANPLISNEQVWQTYEVPDDRAEKMLSDLSLDLKKILGRELYSEEKKFRNIILLDDFTASGISYFRKDFEKGEYAGKISTLLNRITNESSNKEDLSRLIDPKDVNIYILFYVATEQALKSLRKLINKWLKEKNILKGCFIRAIQVIPNEISKNLKEKEEIIPLLIKYFNNDIIDKHYRKGNCERPYLGFNQCALPLVLYHNTPNNSIPLLWFGDQNIYKGLFPRVSRHREEI